MDWDTKPGHEVLDRICITFAEDGAVGLSFPGERKYTTHDEGFCGAIALFLMAGAYNRRFASIRKMALKAWKDLGIEETRKILEEFGLNVEDK